MASLSAFEMSTSLLWLSVLFFAPGFCFLSEFYGRFEDRQNEKHKNTFTWQNEKTGSIYVFIHLYIQFWESFCKSENKYMENECCTFLVWKWKSYEREKKNHYTLICYPWKPGMFTSMMSLFLVFLDRQLFILGFSVSHSFMRFMEKRIKRWISHL